MASTDSDKITIKQESPPRETSLEYVLTRRMKDLLNREYSGSELSKRELKELAQKLSVALESTMETVERLVYYPLQASTVRAAMDLNVFGILNGNGVMNGSQLAEMTGADHDVLVRILRHLAAMDVIRQIANDAYVKNEITERLATPAATAFFKFSFDAKGAACMALPKFLEKCKYRHTYDPDDCAFQFGNRSEYDCWEWSDHHRTVVDEFCQAVEPYAQQASWLNFYPFETRLKAGHQIQVDQVALVNIAGGRGHECEAIQAKYPVLPGRMVLQDSIDNIAHAVPVKGMHVMEHSIFYPQPIKGARVYLMRNVLFKYSELDCLKILNMITPAMAIKYSLLVISEPILLDQDASLRSTQIDLSLMACRSTITRTRGEWGRLLALAGLEITGIWTNVPETDSVIEACLPEPTIAVQ